MPSPIKRKLDDEEEDIKAEENENLKLESAEINQQKKARFEDESDNDFGNFSVPDEAEVGIIETVSLVNFMCHTNLEIRLGAKVNYITGRNGSGKSAILNALIVGLGGKANLTNRGNSLKGFIKEGCNFCNISITIRNRGIDGYKNEQYGDVILIERMHAHDCDWYLIKNHKTGKVVSETEDELHIILKHFNIQIDNPVSMLTQDTAQTFLNTTDKKDKYTIFCKATQLEQMAEKCEEMIEQKNKMKDQLNQVKIVEICEEVRFYEEKYKDMEPLHDMEKKMKEFKQHLVWALVKEKLEKANEASLEVRTREKRLPATRNAIEEAKVKEEEFVKVANLKKEEVNVLTEEVQQLDYEKQRLAEVAQQKKKDLKYAQDTVKTIKKDITSNQRKKQILSDEIDNLQKRVQLHEAEGQLIKHQILVKTKELQKVQSQLATSKHYYNQIKETIQQSNNRKIQLLQEVAVANKATNTLRSKLTELQARGKNSLLAYGKSTCGIIKAIDEVYSQGRFHQKPLGPLGSMIKLRDQKWDKAVEQCLKGTIGAYACHDDHDELQLQQIFRKYSKYTKVARPPIVVCPFADHLIDVSRTKPQNYTAVMDVLLIENHIVANTLIAECNIESVLLFKNEKEAQNVIWQKSPPSLKGISRNGDEVKGGRTNTYYPSTKHSARYLQVDIGTTISQCEEDLARAERYHQNLQNQHTALQRYITRDQNEKNLTHRKCMAEQDLINAIVMELQELNNFETEKPPDVAALKSELEEYDQKLKTLMGNTEQQKLTVLQATTDYQQQYSVFKEAKEKLQVNLEELEKLVNESDNLDNKVNETKGHKLHYEGKLNELMLKINKGKSDQEALQREYELNHSLALQHCEEVTVTERSTTLQNRIDAQQKRIERRGLIPDQEKRKEVVEKYNQALKRYQEHKEVLEKDQKALRCIEKELAKGARRYEKFQKSLTDRARLHFDMLLSQRGYVGKMKINHEKETLTIQVDVENAKGASTKDSNSLSGGERSFSTICFIMALWNAMEAPFRCLDNFDVFMDLLNRKMSIDIMTHIAKEQRMRQFIFFTSQAVSNVTDGDKVKIIKLPNPK